MNKKHILAGVLCTAVIMPIHGMGTLYDRLSNEVAPRVKEIIMGTDMSDIRSRISIQGLQNNISTVQNFAQSLLALVKSAKGKFPGAVSSAIPAIESTIQDYSAQLSSLQAQINDEMIRRALNAVEAARGSNAFRQAQATLLNSYQMNVEKVITELQDLNAAAKLKALQDQIQRVISGQETNISLAVVAQALPVVYKVNTLLSNLAGIILQIGQTVNDAMPSVQMPAQVTAALDSIKEMSSDLTSRVKKFFNK